MDRINTVNLTPYEIEDEDENDDEDDWKMRPNRDRRWPRATRSAIAESPSPCSQSFRKSSSSSSSFSSSISYPDVPTRPAAPNSRTGCFSENDDTVARNISGPTAAMTIAARWRRFHFRLASRSLSRACGDLRKSKSGAAKRVCVRAIEKS
jgi:hypothetical protein